MTVGETIAVAVAVLDVAYVVCGYCLRTALDRTKRHTPLSTDFVERRLVRAAAECGELVSSLQGMDRLASRHRLSA